MTPEFLFDLGRGLSALAFGVLTLAIAVGIAVLIGVSVFALASNVVAGVLIRRKLLRNVRIMQPSTSSNGTATEEEA